MSVVACTSFPEPKDLKEILELFDKLKDSVHAKKNVGQKLLKDVQKYCKDTDKFYKSGSGSEVLWNVFSNANGIRKSILKSSGKYDKYNNFDRDHAIHNDCVPRALKKCLPKAFAALYYLYFMGNKTFNSGKGWSTNKCDGKNGGGDIFYKWLTDDKFYGKMPGLIARGFPEETSKLTSQTAQDVADNIKNIIKHDSAASLQKVLLYLLFSCPWHDSLLGHALCFLYTFCSKVSAEEGLEGKLKGYSGDLKTVCQELQRNLTPFIFGSSHLFAVCKSNTTLYSQLWDDNKFDTYVKWLKEKLPRIIESLQSMSSDCTQWDSDNLQLAKTPGPFPYGFVFKGSWGDHTFKSQLPSKISSLIDSDPGSLQSLQKSLEKFSTGNPGATAGGVFTGLFGLGGAGAGAAYATNAFGFQNFITGLISSFLK